MDVAVATVETVRLKEVVKLMKYRRKYKNKMWNKNQKNVTSIFGKIPTILAKRLDELEIVG